MYSQIWKIVACLAEIVNYYTRYHFETMKHKRKVYEIMRSWGLPKLPSCGQATYPIFSAKQLSLITLVLGPLLSNVLYVCEALTSINALVLANNGPFQTVLFSFSQIYNAPHKV